MSATKKETEKTARERRIDEIWSQRAAARVSLACEDLFLTAEEEELFDQMERDGCDEDEMIRRVREYNTMKDQEELSVTIAVK
jgi:hypothetical protein